MIELSDVRRFQDPHAEDQANLAGPDRPVPFTLRSGAQDRAAGLACAGPRCDGGCAAGVDAGGEVETGGGGSFPELLRHA